MKINGRMIPCSYCEKDSKQAMFTGPCIVSKVGKAFPQRNFKAFCEDHQPVEKKEEIKPIQ